MSATLRFNLPGALLAAAMLSSLVLVLGGAIQRIIPGWNPLYLAAASLLVALEVAFVQFTIRRERMWASEGLRYLVAELAVLAVLMRVVATLAVGVESLRLEAPIWLRSPLLAIFDARFGFCMLMGLLVALAARGAARSLQELAPQEFEHLADPEGGSGAMRGAVAHERSAALRSINRGFIVGGVLLLVALSVQVVNIEQLGGAALPLPLRSSIAALTYLICGFLLYSRAQLAMLQARWQSERSAVEPRVLQRWSRTSVLLVVVLALGVLVLPRSYGLGLLDTLRTALGAFGTIVAYLGYLLLWLVSTLLMLPMLLLAWLFSSDAPADNTPPPPPPPPPPPLSLQAEGTPPLLPSLIFWLCVALLAGYALWTVLQRHAGLRQLLRLDMFAQALRGWLGTLWHDTAGWTRLVAERVGNRLRRAQPGTAPRWPSLRLARLAPRDLIRYFYRSTLERTTRRGIGRKRAQTPYEYSGYLSDKLPELRNDIADLTNAFVAAEYGPHEPQAAQMGPVRRAWNRLRQRLRPTNTQ